MPTQDKPSSFIAMTSIESPLGPLLLVASQGGLAGVWFDAQRHHPGTIDAPARPSLACFTQAQRWLTTYWNGQVKPLPTSLTLDPQGTPFQQKVWLALLQIPAGQTTSYSSLAQRVGSPTAARAVGAAVGRNPLGIIVPCHRVVGSNGSLTGYAGGLARKQFLLSLEGAPTQQALRLSH
jgi:methylated-DNA-[protein]-cysteine S-methyltransferase